MRRPRVTILQLVALMPVAAVQVREPRADDGPFEWLTTAAVVILLLPFVLGLDRRRAMISAAGSGVIFLMMAVNQFAPNRAAVLGCLALGLIAWAARDLRDLGSAVLAVALGVLVGSATSDPCSPNGVLLGPLVGLGVRWAARRPRNAGAGEPLPETQGLC